MGYEARRTESIKEYNPDMEIAEQFNYNCDDLDYEEVTEEE